MSHRLIIAGTRDLPDAKRRLWALIQEQPEVFADVSELASGHSGVVDLAGEAWAAWAKVPVRLFPYPAVAELQAKGVDVSQLADPVRAGGPIRNRWMAEWAAEVPGSVLVLLWDGRSTGSASMRREALKVGLRVVESYRSVSG